MFEQKNSRKEPTYTQFVNQLCIFSWQKSTDTFYHLFFCERQNQKVH